MWVFIVWWWCRSTDPLQQHFPGSLQPALHTWLCVTAGTCALCVCSCSAEQEAALQNAWVTEQLSCPVCIGWVALISTAKEGVQAAFPTGQRRAVLDMPSHQAPKAIAQLQQGAVSAFMALDDTVWLVRPSGVRDLVLPLGNHQTLWPWLCIFGASSCCGRCQNPTTPTASGGGMKRKIWRKYLLKLNIYVIIWYNWWGASGQFNFKISIDSSYQPYVLASQPHLTTGHSIMKTGMYFTTI